jgi:TolB protein
MARKCLSILIALVIFCLLLTGCSKASTASMTPTEIRTSTGILIPTNTKEPTSTLPPTATQGPSATRFPTITKRPTITLAPTPNIPFNIYSHPDLNGKLAFSVAFSGGGAGLSYGIYVMNADGSKLTRLSHWGDEHLNPTFSPDGRQIAFFAEYGQIFVMNADGTGKLLLAKNASQFSWEPDGRKIRFTGLDFTKTDNSNNEKYDNFTVKVDGSQPAELYNPWNNKYLRGFPYRVIWSPDGKKIAALNNHFYDGKIIVMNVDESGITTINTGADTFYFELSWSPDGKKIGYSLWQWNLEEFKPLGLYIMNADGSEQTMVYATGVNRFAWSPDGKKIAFTTKCEIDIINADGDNLVKLLDLCVNESDTYFYGISWAP